MGFHGKREGKKTSMGCQTSMFSPSDPKPYSRYPMQAAIAVKKRSVDPVFFGDWVDPLPGGGFNPFD